MMSVIVGTGQIRYHKVAIMRHALPSLSQAAAGKPMGSFSFGDHGLYRGTQARVVVNDGARHTLAIN